ncbi:MAG: type III pantothenate kinase [Candidatus Omnitrophota bacterium]|jgi:type III pantothenate kinase
MIVIDVGNTSLHFYRENKNKISLAKEIKTNIASEAVVRKAVGLYKKESVIVCSVVPRVTDIFKKLKKKLPKTSIHIVGEDVKVSIKCFYNKKSVGMDRVVGAFAAKSIYKDARIVIDFGTAITFDILSKSGDYEGGLILPGIGSTLKVLSSCALIPKTITLKKSKVVIPRDTKESIYKGLEESFSSMVNHLVDKYKKILNLPSGSKVIITGGDAKFILPDLKFRYIYEPYLVAKGLIRLGKR